MVLKLLVDYLNATIFSVADWEIREIYRRLLKDSTVPSLNRRVWRLDIIYLTYKYRENYSGV